MNPLGTFLRGGSSRPNAAPSPLRITLARRLVETPGAPFVPSEEVFDDVASARDELGLLPASQGPTVVRVQVEVGTASEWMDLVGDWLVDPDAGDRVARLPAPRWSYADEAQRWASARPWLEAWETCQDARWMLHAAQGVGVERKLLVLAACACAHTALPFVPAGEERPLRALEAAERWARGEATLEEVRSAAEAVWAAHLDDRAVDADAAHAIANVAIGVGTARGANGNAVWAAAVAYYTAAVISHGAARRAAAAWATALARCADLVRREIPTLVVLRAVATRA